MNGPILVGCEESQVITKAFRETGHEAYSCDLQPTRGNPEWHYQRDIMEVIPLKQWDLIILHPDCTAMAVSGNRTYGLNLDGTPKPKHYKRIEQVEWTLKLWDLAKKHSIKVALENPKSVIFTHLRKMGVDIQYVQPYWFGHLESKDTGLALHGLPRLKKTNDVYEEMMKLPIKERCKVWYASPGPNRKRDRSTTYQGVAKAIVEQWGILEPQSGERIGDANEVINKRL